MEFHEKLQELRKRNNLTQEELAQRLYVSRTAISKWESGRGYPNIDSLKAIAKFYGVTIDELLSGEEILTIAEADNKQKLMRSRDLVFGLLDMSALLLFFLPLLGQKAGEVVQTFSLLTLEGIAPYMRVAYIVIVSAMTTWGIVTLVLQTARIQFWLRIKTVISCALHVMGLLLFIVGSQPYAAALLLFLMLVKMLMLIRKC